MSFIEIVEGGRAYEVFKKREAAENVLPGELICGERRKKKKRKPKNDPARIRTWNPLIRSQMPYPLGHRATRLQVLKQS